MGLHLRSYDVIITSYTHAANDDDEEASSGEEGQADNIIICISTYSLH